MEQRFLYAASITEQPIGITSPLFFGGDLAEGFRKAAECGYDGVELQIADPKDKNVEEIKALCKQYNLSIPCVTTGMECYVHKTIITSDDPAMNERGIARLCEYVDFAAEFNAMILFGSMRGKIGSFDHLEEKKALLKKNLLPVLQYAREKGVDVVIEPINLYFVDYLASTDETAEFVKEVGMDNFHVMIDTHHMVMHDTNIYSTVQNNDIRYVHYSDSNRLYPGGGNFDFLTCTKALVDKGYQGWVTMECVAGADAMQSAKRAIEYTKHLEMACRTLYAF